MARLDEATLAAALRETTVAELKPGSPDGIVDLLVASGLSASKGAARRTIHEGGVSVNNIRVDNEEWVPQSSDFLHGRWLVLRRGKRSIAGVERIG
ncbi:tyrosyl-tRNA synthase [Mycobacterium tuberculosis]|nr:tyrosyl-tRNA synthase [Mycobacterium tuberculosis]CNV56532.1 tyrosyl-tRNA synthase [Mycobacterium tuberculosis]